MTTHRFFCSVQEGRALLSSEQWRQIRTVLRLRDGARIAVFDGSGGEWSATLTGQTAVLGPAVERSAEMSVEITLYEALARPAHLEVALQKCTELGASRFVLFAAERSVVSGDRHARWRSIVTEAAEQSGRQRVPDVQLMSFAAALEEARGDAGRNFLAWEGTHEPKLGQAFRPAPKLGMFIGPEGGFTSEEVGQAAAAGVHIISLGRRILRAETAAIAAVAILAQLSGEL